MSLDKNIEVIIKEAEINASKVNDKILTAYEILQCHDRQVKIINAAQWLMTAKQAIEEQKKKDSRIVTM